MKKLNLIILLGIILVASLNVNTIYAGTDKCIVLKSDMRLYSEDTDTNTDVSKLQTFLKNKGYYSGEINGYYNRATSKSVLSFQKANNIKLDKNNSTKYSTVVGPKTREKIMSLTCLKEGKSLPKAIISATPSPKAIISNPSPSATYSTTPTATYTPKYSSTPSPIYTSTPTYSPSVTSSPSTSPSPVITSTPSPTTSSSPSPSVTVTSTPSPSPTTSSSPSPSPSSSVSPSPSSSPVSAIPLWKSLLAEAGVATEAKKVKIIIPDSNTPPAEIVALPDGAGFADILQCADPSQRKGDSSMYQEYVKERSKCAQNIADATTVGQRIEHLTQSIDVVDRMLNSLKITKEYADKLTSLNNDSFVLIPFGGEQKEIYEQVSGISMKCLLNSNASQKSLVPVGTSASTKGTLYIAMTEEQKRFVSKLRTDAVEITKYVADERAKSKDGELGFVARLFKAQAVMSLKSAGEKYLMPIIPSLLDKNHPYIKEDGVLVFDAHTLRAFASEKKILDDLRLQINKKLKDLTAKVQEYKTQKAELQSKLNTVAKNGYSCGGNISLSSNSAGNPPPPPPPASSLSKSQASISTEKTSINSDENIHIKFSSPINTTKTALYISCPTGISSLAVGFECNKLISAGKYFNAMNASFINRASEAQKVTVKFYTYTDDREGTIESFPLVIYVNPTLISPLRSKVIQNPTYTPSYTSTPSYTHTPTYSTTPTHNPSPTHSPSVTTSPSASPSASYSPVITSLPSPTISTSPSSLPSPSTTPSTTSSPSSSPSSSASPSPSSSPTSVLPMMSNQNASLWQAIVEWFRSF